METNTVTEQQVETLLSMKRSAETLEKLAGWYGDVGHLPGRAAEARALYERTAERIGYRPCD